MIDTSVLDSIAPAGNSADLYAVPEGDAETLLAFIRKLRQHRPVTGEAHLEYRVKAAQSIAQAARKIIELAPEAGSATQATAALALLEPRLAAVGEVVRETRETLVDELAAALGAKAKHGLEPAELAMAVNFGRTLELGDDDELAAKAHLRLAEAIAAGSDPNAELVRRLRGTARRLGLVGQEFKMAGPAVSGKAFDWGTYRGKVVLVHFWATWCGPCRAELPTLRKLYLQYHDRNFDIVGVSLDRNRKELDVFLDKERLPWTTLHDLDRGHTLAIDYGVHSIPTMLLVGSDGKVVSIRARGPELQRLLVEQLGPPDEESRGK